MKETLDYISSNTATYISELQEFLRIPSISNSAEHTQEMQRCAKFVADKLTIAGMNRVEIYQTEGHPVVYGEWLGAPGKPTVLIYGHYDVQPVDPIELWDSQPFDPVIKNGKIFARGATDDKGQVYTHIKAVESLFKTLGSLPLNVKFIIEGEEEIGSGNLEPFVKNNKDLLKCDTVVISDTALYAPGLPTITYGLRGLAYCEVEVVGPDRDLHSGSYGGAVPNPINVLAKMISQLHDAKGKITVPHFYDTVIKLTAKERAAIKTLKFSDKAFGKEIGLTELSGEAGFTTLERLWVRPTLDCNGIFGGFTGKGAKTVIPSKATAKISMRLVPGQDPKKVMSDFAKHVKNLAPKNVKVTVHQLHSGNPVLTPLDSSATVAASKAMEKAFGKKTVFIREGGSIPIVHTFAKLLKAPVVLMGFGLNNENLHSPNEHFDLKHFELGIKSSALFMKEFAGSN